MAEVAETCACNIISGLHNYFHLSQLSIGEATVPCPRIGEAFISNLGGIKAITTDVFLGLHLSRQARARIYLE